jgi:hypothetical protein
MTESRAEQVFKAIAGFGNAIGTLTLVGTVLAFVMAILVG